MGLIDRVAAAPLDAVGAAARDMSEVFVPNATRQAELDAETQRAALEAASAEFAHAGPGGFDRAVNALNRLPRPLLALGTLGPFVYAMADPAGFALRMRGLSDVPEPLWWLLGAVVSFYFGARELHYRREGALGAAALMRAATRRPALRQAPADDPVAANPALSAWRAEATEDASTPN